MLFADLRQSKDGPFWPAGTLGNIRDSACVKAPAACNCPGPHFDPESGTLRVVLSALPTDDVQGPWTIDAAGVPQPHTANTLALWDARLNEAVARSSDLQAKKAALSSASASPTVSSPAEADLSAAQADVAMWAGKIAKGM